MARIFITGSSTGLGLLAGQRLARAGHAVVLHARNEQRADEARRALTDAQEVVIGDLATIRGAREVAQRVNALGRFNAVIHNAGLLHDDGTRTEDGLPAIFAVNALAPYILTCLVTPPERLVYLSSSMHAGTEAQLDDLDWRGRRWNATQAYSESKLYVLLLAFVVSRVRQQGFANAVDPGWVPTRMGGSGAPDNLDKGAETQAVLAAPDAGSPLATVTGEYLHHLRVRRPSAQAHDEALQDAFVAHFSHLTGYQLGRSDQSSPNLTSSRPDTPTTDTSTIRGRT